MEQVYSRDLRSIENVLYNVRKLVCPLSFYRTLQILPFTSFWPKSPPTSSEGISTTSNQADFRVSVGRPCRKPTYL